MFRTRLTSVLLTFSLVALLSSCGSAFQTTIKKGVIGSVEADVGSFASATVSALGAERTELRKSRMTRLRVYFDENAPEVRRLRRLLLEVLELRRLVVLYSLDLVQLSSRDSTPEANIQLLAKLVNTRFRAKLTSLGTKPARIDAAIKKVGEQKKLHEAISAVNPLIARLASENERLLLEIEDSALPEVLSLFDLAIEKDFEEMRRLLRQMDDRRKTLLEALELINEARLGVTEAEAELQDRRIFLEPSMTPPLKPSEQDLNRAEKYLIEELQKDALIRSFVAPREEIYLATRAEYDDESARLRKGVQIARVQFSAWQRAYEALGNGVENPGKWLVVAAQLAGAAL